MNKTDKIVFMGLIQIVNGEMYNMSGGGKCYEIKKQGKGIDSVDESWGCCPRTR